MAEHFAYSLTSFIIVIISMIILLGELVSFGLYRDYNNKILLIISAGDVK